MSWRKAGFFSGSTEAHGQLHPYTEVSVVQPHTPQKKFGTCPLKTSWGAGFQIFRLCSSMGSVCLNPRCSDLQIGYFEWHFQSAVVATPLQAVLSSKCFSFSATQLCLLQQGGSTCLPKAHPSCQVSSCFPSIHSVLPDRASCKSYLKIH